MTRMLLAVALISGFGIYVYGQTTTAPLSLAFSADTLMYAPANGYDGVLRVGRADNVRTFSGNVVIVINGTRVTADAATWHDGSKEIELNGGSVRVQLPDRPVTSLSIVRRR